MIYTYAATALVSAGIAFAGAWQIQDWRFNTKELDRANTIQISERADAEKELHKANTVIQAQNKARQRDVLIVRAAVNSRSELERLRSESASALQAASSSLDACIAGANTSSELLIESAGRYQELAATADRHVSDIQTLMDAWPNQ